MFRFVLFACFIAANVNAFQWLETLPDGATVVTCSGDVIHLPFNFTLAQTEQINAMKWVFAQAERRADEDIAIYSGGHFVVMPAFSGRVQWLGEGGITISHSGVLESGNYSVEVTTVEFAGHTFQTRTRTAHVLIADAPRTEAGVLHVLQKSQAVYDVSSGEWRVQLTCGKFESLGQPPVGDVVWTAPDGQVLPSTSGPINGTFTLLLPNPPLGGNYSCSLPSPSVFPSASCLPPHSQIRQGASVAVDEVRAAFVLLETRQKDLQSQLDAKTAELEALKSKTDALQSVQDKLATKISFHACLTTPSSGGPILPFTTISDEGNAFNASNGTFVAPVTGTYMFIASANTGVGTNNQALNFYLSLEGTYVSGTYAEEFSGFDVAATVNAVVRVQKGQRVWLQSSEGHYGSYPFTCFSGFLISRDD